MTCLEFWAWFGSGILIVPLLAILKGLPTIGAVVKEWAWIIAPMLAALLPQIASALSPTCAKIDPALWVVVYTALAYLVSQLLFWLATKFGIKV
jgi:hypothetical protein